MTFANDAKIFGIMLIVNFLAAVSYLLAGIFVIAPSAGKKGEGEESGNVFCDNRTAYGLKFAVMVLCPVVGPLFFLVSYLLYRTIFRFQVNLDDVIFGKDRVRTQQKADEDRERNIIPVEEAIAVSDKKSLRMAMMNIIKGETEDSLASIALALDVEDSESAHYAASVLSSKLNEFRMNVQRMYGQLKEEDTGQTECEEQLLDYMDDVLRQNVFTELEQNRFVKMMDETAELLYEKKASQMTEGQYENVCLRLLEIKDFENSEKWCQRLSEQYPDLLSAYTCRLKLYFTTKDRAAFFQTLDAMRKSDVVLNREALEMVRIFS